MGLHLNAEYYYQMVSGGMMTLDAAAEALAGESEGELTLAAARSMVEDPCGSTAKRVLDHARVMLARLLPRDQWPRWIEE